MRNVLKHSWMAGLALGLIGGLIIGGLWPDTPLHAVATDRNETFAMATGPLDNDLEAVFLLDFLTGDLRGYALGRQPGGFLASFQRNILADLGVDPGKNPRFLMVTGVANLRRGGARLQPSQAVLYIAEITTGKLAAYGIPWSPAARASNRPISQPFLLLGVVPFRGATATPAAVAPLR